MAEPKNSSFHIAMFPWFAFGHMTPFLHLGNKLAERGYKISLLLPKKAISQLEPYNLYPNLINFHPIIVPHVEGLPQGAETASDIPIFLTNQLITAMDLTKDQVVSLITSLNPDFIFYDFSHWIPEIAFSLRVKSICYIVVSAASIAFSVSPDRNITMMNPISEEELAVPPTGYPSSKIVLRRHEAKELLFLNLEFGKGITFYERLASSLKNCDVLAIRTSKELEGPLCDYLGSQFQKRILLTGPVLPEASLVATLESQWADWLGQFDLGSVVFCAFGSQFVPEKNQFQELMLGFELTGLPFLVALKPPPGTSSVEEALPEGFKERVQGRGVVHGGWVQQPLILDHPSVGCFVSHCGFGSMWESLKSDCQIVLVPHLGDQILNTRLMADDLEVAVEVQREDDGWVSKENLYKAIKSVMDKDSEVGCMVRKNHARWREVEGQKDFAKGHIDNVVLNLEELRRN